MSQMEQLCTDLREEADALRALMTGAGLAPDRVTPFMGWTVRNSLSHIVTIDRLATLAFCDIPKAAEERRAFAAGTTQPSTAPIDRYRAIADYEEARLGLLSWEQLIAAWDIGLDQLIAAARAAGDDARVEWFGGAMRAPSLLSARHMEVWAYGQDVFDAAEADRPDGERLRNVVEFGLKTFGFSFANRGEPVPTTKPYLALISPGGVEWTWNDPAAGDRITGSARDLALVTTQRRHVADTDLTVEGPVAARWMAIAQSIAGVPMDGPAPGRLACG
ncbi:MAG: maleylpyruvate isomerase family mycothiol-dependent enzyme [Sphingobium sp.]